MAQDTVFGLGRKKRKGASYWSLEARLRMLFVCFINEAAGTRGSLTVSMNHKSRFATECVLSCAIKPSYCSLM
jgi:hypothetical protein